MQCDPSDISPIITPFPTTLVELISSLYCPLYTISGLEAVADSWYKGTAGDRTEISLNLKKHEFKELDSLGIFHSIKQSGGGLFGIIGKTKATTTTTTEEFDGWSSKFQEEVEFKLSFSGAPVEFNIGAGVWYVFHLSIFSIPIGLSPTDSEKVKKD